MGPDQGIDLEPQALPKIEKITSTDIKPEVPDLEGTVIVLQRNAKDKESRKLPSYSEKLGNLDEGEAENTQREAKNFFDQIFKPLSPEDRQTIDILVIAGDTKLITPIPGVQSKNQRAITTASYIIAGAKQSIEELGISTDQLLNQFANDGKPIPVSELKDLKMMEDSPEFVQFLSEKYGTGLDFWDAYESDKEKEVREQIGVEGPGDIADRVENFLGQLNLLAKEYHAANPGKRLIIWADSHYDSISPYLKKHVLGMDEPVFLGSYLPIDYRGGITIKIGVAGDVKTTLAGQNISLNLAI